MLHSSHIEGWLSQVWHPRAKLSSNPLWWFSLFTFSLETSLATYFCNKLRQIQWGNSQTLSFWLIQKQIQVRLCIFGRPSCYECSTSPERRKITVGSVVQESVQSGQRKNLIQLKKIIKKSLLEEIIWGQSKTNTSHVNDYSDGNTGEWDSLHIKTPDIPQMGSANTVWPHFRVNICNVWDRRHSACHNKDIRKFLNAWSSRTSGILQKNSHFTK